MSLFKFAQKQRLQGIKKKIKSQDASFSQKILLIICWLCEILVIPTPITEFFFKRLKIDYM